MAKNLVLFNGKWASIKEHCQDLGISYITAKVRKRKTGESYEQVLAYYANPDRLDKKGLAIEFNGKIASIAEHCRNIGIKPRTVYEKKANTNWDYPKVLQYFQNKVKSEKSKLIELDGELLTRQEYCKKLNYNYKAIYNYMHKYNLSWENAVIRYLNYETTKSLRNKELHGKWENMLDRCYNPKNVSYPRYGGKKPTPITVQESWHDYNNFAKDMLKSFLEHVKEYGIKDTTLDRWPNRNGNYEISNVRWATREEQANNKDVNIWVAEGKTLADFCRENNLNYDTTRQRYVNGWSLEEIINSDKKLLQLKCKIFTQEGETIPELAKRLHMSINTIRTRLKLGWSIEKIINTPIRQNYKYFLPCKQALKSICKLNNYDYKAIRKFISKYNLAPDKALAMYLEKKHR